MTPTPPTYPARPVNGGPLPLAPVKRGGWAFEPKLNGWRALIHVPSGTMFNRHGQRLSIAAAFTPALHRLRQLFPDGHPIVWLDCEALERRHTLGQGTLFILDFIPPAEEVMFADPDRNPCFFGMRPGSDYDKRRTILESICGPADLALDRPPPPDQVILTASFPGRGLHTGFATTDPLDLWDTLQDANTTLREHQRALGVRDPQDFYEGVVAKRRDAAYPCQLRRADETTPAWMKHRWSW